LYQNLLQQTIFLYGFACLVTPQIKFQNMIIARQTIATLP